MKILKKVLSLFRSSNKVNVSKTMSTYEKTISRMKKRIYTYQSKCDSQRHELLKVNNFINKLRDDGKITKEEIEVYFKKSK